MTYVRSRFDHRRNALMLLGALWLVIFFAALFGPPVLDDADATHAAAARATAKTGDWVTLHVDGVRYLEKAPLPYWLTAISFRLFGYNTFAVHLPLALAVLALTLLGYSWAGRVFGARAAFYTGLFTLTSVGVFLFTRVFLPEALLSLFLALALYARLRSLEDDSHAVYAYIVPAALAGAVLSKGLVTFVFFDGTILAYLALTGEYRKWRRLRVIPATLLFLLLAAPWHILAGLRNRGGMNGHGFFWFYFINEHVLRFLGRRTPMDYNKLPAPLYWSLHLIWLFPWSIFAPVAIALGWRARRNLRGPRALLTPQQKTVLLLAIFSCNVLVFFSLSTNQEYYTFPAYLPLLMLIAVAISYAEKTEVDSRGIKLGHAAFALIGIAVAVTLAYGLWTSRQLARISDIGAVLVHRGVGNYTLSMSHFFDLTGPSFAALRLPSALAAFTLALGPIEAWILRSRRQPVLSTLAIGATSSVFLIAAHLAFLRFAPMLSSVDFAEKILQLQTNHAISANRQVLIYGDQAFGSSLTFYLNEPIYLVEGRSTSMLFGSTFPDAPAIFLSAVDLTRSWGNGPRKLLFVPLEQRDAVDHLLGARAILLKETSGKALFTDRPLEPPSGVTP